MAFALRLLFGTVKRINSAGSAFSPISCFKNKKTPNNGVKKMWGEMSFGKHLHCFKIYGPIDELKKSPFSLSGLLGGKVCRIDNTKKTDPPNIRFKKINLKESYLETFIRQMM